MPIAQQESLECTPSGLLAANPCLQCLSELELLAALVAIFATASETYANDVPKLLKDSACLTCLSKKQMFQAVVTIAGESLLGENTTVQEVIDKMRCLVCSNEKQLSAAFLFLLCNDIALSGGTEE